MPGGRSKTSGKSDNKSSKTYLTVGCDQASTSTVLPVTRKSSITNYLKNPAEKSTNVNITEEPLTGVPWVEIEDEDENMNDKIAPIFQINKLKTATESTKILISKKKAPDKQTKSTSSIYCKWETKSLGLTLTILKTDSSAKGAKSNQTLYAHWRTLPQKHDDHPSQYFFDHENSSKHLNSIKNKKEILNVISTGIIVHQIAAGAETQSNASRDRSRWLIYKSIKTTYILTRKKWAVKFNFKNVIDFLDDIGDPEIRIT